MDKKEEKEHTALPCHDSTHASYADMIESLSGRHRTTLAALLTEPSLANIKYDAFVALMMACGAQELKRRMRSGSRRGFSMVVGGIRYAISLHEPHPQKELDKGAVGSVRRFFLQIKDEQ